jgi:ribosomal protein S27E
MATPCAICGNPVLPLNEASDTVKCSTCGFVPADCVCLTRDRTGTLRGWAL